MRFIPVILFMYCFSLAATAQPRSGEGLLVYSIKGKATFIENKKERPLQIGKVLLSTAVVKASQGTRIVLVCPQGKAMSIAKKGMFTLKPLQDSCRLKYASVSDQYFRYIWSEMVGSGNSQGGEEPKKAVGLQTIGGVARSVIPDQPLEPYVDQLLTAHTDFNLSWKSGPQDSVFVFLLLNKQGAELYRDTVPTGKMSMNRLIPFLSAGENYQWKVVKPGGPSSRTAGLYFVSPEQADRTRQSLENATSFPESAAEKLFRTAFLLEQRNFLVDALDYYRQAADQPGALPLYRQRLNEFRNKFQLD